MIDPAIENCLLMKQG